jgi:hypothetical protein
MDELLYTIDDKNQKIIQDSKRSFIEEKKAEYASMEEEAAEIRRQAELRRHPTLKQLFDRMYVFEDYTGMKLNNIPHVKMAVLKRIHIILDYLKMPAIPDEMEPSLEYALGLRGRADLSLELIEEIGKILQDFSGYSFIRTYPREALELREHMRTQSKLAGDLVRAIAFKKIKESGIYEPKTSSVGSGEVLPTETEKSVGQN